MQGLSKSRLLAHRQCPRRLWLQTYHPDLLEEDAAAEARYAVGHQVGEIARSLHPDGVLIETENLQQALAETERLLKEPPRPLFEATFQTDGVLVRADLLLPDKKKCWRMVEVKSSASVKDYHLTDAAVQAWVGRNAGINVSRLEIAHIDTSFVYPGGDDYRGLLTRVDVTEQIAELEPDVENWVKEARLTLAGADPKTPPGEQCTNPFDCPFLHHCSPEDDEDAAFPPEILPRAKALARELWNEGYTDLRDVPRERLTKPHHIRIWEATTENKTVLDHQASDILNDLSWPRYYMDFETIQLAVPVWAGTRPYAQVPFQWSCHIEKKGGEIQHLEFLADGKVDPRRQFAESLLSTLGDSGPIIVYNAGFESTRMKELAEQYPDLAEPLADATERIFDLLPIARKHYYHPDMRGSWSIKAVLPTIAPGLSYDDLAVSDGALAQQAFAEMMQPDTSIERATELRNGLLSYCQRDTLAMVRLAHYFGTPND